MNLVFDTSILIDALRLKRGVVDLFTTLERGEHELYLPSVVGFELFSGKSSKEPAQRKCVEDFLGYFAVIDLTWEIARRAGELFRDDVRGLAVPDYIVAASALEIGGTVLTLNQKHFSRIPGLALYSL